MAWHDSPMSTIYDIRLGRLQAILLAKFGGNKADLARAIGKDPTYVSRMLNPDSPQFKRIGEETAREIEFRLQLPPRALDGESGGKPVESAALYGMSISQQGVAVGSEWDKLREPLRSQIQVLIETLVAMQVREDRKKKKARSDSSRQPRTNA